ncbi:MAG: dienelactone hydrolase family protein [Kiritimatiellia bacterium]
MKYLFSLLFLTFGMSPALRAGQIVEYQVGDLEYSGYYSSAGEETPLVLLLHDWDGLTDYEMKRADMLVEQGISVFAADLFGKGIRPTELKDKREHTEELYTNRDKLRTLLQGALQAAAAQGASLENTVVMGYCFGGAAALEFARAGFNSKGVVTFHGGLGTPEGQNYENNKGKILVFHGTADTLIPMEDFAGLAVELEQAQVPHELISYGGAPHSFPVFGGEAYREEADQQSWSRFLRFIREVSTP